MNRSHTRASGPRSRGSIIALVITAIAVGALLLCGVGALTFSGLLHIGSSVSCTTAETSHAAASSAPGAKRWQLALGPRPEVPNATPLVANGLVYVTYGEVRVLTGIAGGTTGVETCSSLFALDARTGAVRWRRTDPADDALAAHSRIQLSLLTLANGTIYVGGGGSVLALDASTGAQRWQSATLGTHVLATPVVANGLVYVSFGDKLVALDATTGTERWHIITNGGRSGSVGIPLVAEGLLYVVSYAPDNATIYSQVGAWDATTGQPRWHFAATSPSAGEPINTAFSPMAANGLVYAPLQDGVLYALDGRTGAKRWQRAMHDPRVNSTRISHMTVADDAVYVATYDGRLNALDARTGAQRWELRTDGQTALAPVVAEGTVYAHSLGPGPSGLPAVGSIYALDARTGAQRWQSPQVSDIVSDLAVANGVVYAGSTNALLALDATTGAQRWRFATGSQVGVGSPVVSDGAVYVTSVNIVFALNA